MQMRVPEIEWQPVSRVQLICWAVFYGLLLLYLALNWGQLTLLDNIHLPIHEGGHLLFGYFGHTLMVAGGTLLALGIAPRLSAVALACSLIPTTLAGHSYWAIEDPAARKQQRIQFHKNLAMLGGLLLAVIDEP